MNAQTMIHAVFVFWTGLPHALAGTLWLLGAWAVAMIGRRALAGMLVLLRFDRMCERTGVAAFLRTGRVDYTPSRLAGAILFWLVLAGGFFRAIKRWDPHVTAALTARLAHMLPGFVAACAILVVGFLLVSFAARFARTLARNAASPYADLLGQGIRLAGGMFAVAAAAEQMGVGHIIILTTFITLLAAAGLGLALAFGLGCRDMARDAMERFLRDVRERSRAAAPGDLED